MAGGVGTVDVDVRRTEVPWWGESPGGTHTGASAWWFAYFCTPTTAMHPHSTGYTSVHGLGVGVECNFSVVWVKEARRSATSQRLSEAHGAYSTASRKREDKTAKGPVWAMITPESRL